MLESLTIQILLSFFSSLDERLDFPKNRTYALTEIYETKQNDKPRR